MAYHKISPSTVVKCFLNCGFVFNNTEDEKEESLIKNENTILTVDLQNLIEVTSGAVCSAKSYVNADENAVTECDSLNLDDIIASVTTTNEVIQIEGESDDDDCQEEIDVTGLEVLDAFQKLEAYGN